MRVADDDRLSAHAEQALGALDAVAHHLLTALVVEEHVALEQRHAELGGYACGDRMWTGTRIEKEQRAVFAPPLFERVQHGFHAGVALRETAAHVVVDAYRVRYGLEVVGEHGPHLER